MTRRCPLCASDRLEAGDVTNQLVDEYTPDDGRPDYLGLKRDLEADLGLDLTVSGIKRHVDDHIRYTWSPDGLGVTT